MRGTATISQEAAAAAITAAGFKLTSFTTGAPARVGAYVIRIAGLQPEQRTAVERAMTQALPRPAHVVLDSTGYATVASVTIGKEAVEPALADKGCHLIELAPIEWPRACALYDVEVRGVAPAAWSDLRSALAGLEKVVTAQVFADRGTALLRLNEPCSKIEERVRGAMQPRGWQVVSFQLRSADSR